MTQDPYLGESNTPPSLHRYLYAYSNPTVYVDLYGYMSVTTELDQAATKAAQEGETAKLIGLVTLQAGYKLADFITFGFIKEHDQARDAYDRGQISGTEYLTSSGKAAAKSGTLFGATLATGGAAALATRSASLTTQLVVAGAASGIGYQAAEDAWNGELSSAGTYLKAGGMGAVGGVVARGAIGLKSTLGNAGIAEGTQVLKTAASTKLANARVKVASLSQNIKQIPKMTGEVKNSIKQAGLAIIEGKGGRLNPLNYELKVEGLGSNLGNARLKFSPKTTTPKSGIKRFPEWKPGDSITKITPEGNYPTWDTIRSRYWKNRDPSGFGSSNQAIMSKGFAPKTRVIVRDRKTGNIYEKLVEKELHHARGNRGVPGYDNPVELREVWPWEHENLLPSGRKLDYEFIEFK